MKKEYFFLKFPLLSLTSLVYLARVNKIRENYTKKKVTASKNLF